MIGIFLNMEQGEVHTDEIIRNAFDDGKLVFLPKCIFESNLTGNQEQDFRYSSKKNHLEFHQVADVKSVEKLVPKGKYKLREPADSVNLFDKTIQGLELLILPGVAYSTENHRINRLGHGAGFYDEFIQRHEHYSKHYNKKSPFLLGVGLLQQLVDSVPVTPHDQPLHGLLIDGKYYGK